MSLQIYENQKQDIDTKIMKLLEQRLLVTGFLSKKTKKTSGEKYKESINDVHTDSKKLDISHLKIVFGKIHDMCSHHAENQANKKHNN